MARSKLSRRTHRFFAPSSAFVVTVPCFGPIRLLACFRRVNETMQADILLYLHRRTLRCPSLAADSCKAPLVSGPHHSLFRSNKGVRTKGPGADSAIRLLTPLFVSALLPPKSPWQTGELLPVDGVIHGRRDGQQRDEFSGCIEHTPSQRPYRIITLLQRHAERSRAQGARSLPTLRGRSSARDVRDIEPLAP